MKWIAPTAKDSDSATLETSLWAAADQFRANSGLKAQEYSGPILGIIFLRFAEVRFAHKRALLTPPPLPLGEGPGVRVRRPPRGEAAVWMSRQRIMLTASCSCRRMPVSTSC